MNFYRLLKMRLYMRILALQILLKMQYYAMPEMHNIVENVGLVEWIWNVSTDHLYMHEWQIFPIFIISTVPYTD